MQSTLYFPELRPDSYFTIGNLVYTSTSLGIKRFKIIEDKELIFYCVDQQDFSRHTFSYTSNQILSDQEFNYVKNLIDRVQDELGPEECTAENIYKLLTKKARDGDSEFVLLFYRLGVMFVKQHSKVKLRVNFIRQVMSFEPSITKQKTTNDPKDMIPMPDNLKAELRQYVHSKHMNLSNYFTNEELDKTSYNKARKIIDDLIESSNQHSY